MKQNAKLGLTDLQAGFDAVFQQLRGKPMGNPMALTGPDGSVVKAFSDIKVEARGPTNADAVYLRFWRAVRRDAMYSTAGPVFVKAFGMRQLEREILDASSEQQKAGASK